MKTAVMIVLSGVISLVLCRTVCADGCRSDLDCGMDERCEVPDYSSIGNCIKFGTFQKDRKPAAAPAPSPPLSSPTRGKFCMSNTDCDPGQSCTKKGNDMSGTCY